MATKKICPKWLLIVASLCASFSVNAQNSLEQTQTLQIYTHFKKMWGNPTWLLILRDVDTGLVTPYVFDIRNNDNFWIAFSYGHNYKVTVSSLTFGRYAVVRNFCKLENGILSGKSMYISLKGTLSPDPAQTKCYVTKYNDTNFTIFKNEQTLDSNILGGI